MRALMPKQNQPQKLLSSNLAQSNTATSRLNHRADLIPHLPHTIGNQAIQRMMHANAEQLKAGSTGTATPRFGHDFSRIPIHSPAAGAIQTKLAINQPGDENEREADRISEQVMRIPEPQRQRTCPCGGGCPKCQSKQLDQEHEHLQDKPLDETNASAVESTPDVSEVTYEAQRQASDSAIGPRLGTLIERSRPSGRLSAEVRPALSGIPGHTLEKIRIYDDSAAHEAARGLEAHSFTIGPSIYFARGAYQPATRAGLRLLAHEAAHAHQQANASVPPIDQLVVSPPSSPEEIEAGRFADAVDSAVAPGPPARMPTGNVARVMRAVTFEAGRNPPEPFDIKNRVYSEFEYSPGDFSFGLGGGAEWVRGDITIPKEAFIFSWKNPVQIHGTPEDKFSNWEVGMLQTVLDYRFDVWWGEGANAKHCLLKFTNLHDGKDNAKPWFDPTTTRTFTADGETLEATIDDSPGAQVPYRNMKGEPSENFGRFDYHAAFVTYVSVHDVAAGDTLDAFRQLKSVRWQVNLKGDFDGRTSPPQVHAEGGTTVDGIIDIISPSSELPPVIGGPSAYDELRKLQACWTPEKKK